MKIKKGKKLVSSFSVLIIMLSLALAFPMKSYASISWTDITGSEAFIQLTGIAVDGSGNVYVTDIFDNKIKKLSNGIWTDITGSGGFDAPYGIAVDGSGNVYVTDSNNRKIKKLSNGIWTDITGSEHFNQPFGIAADASGNVYVADTLGNKIKKLSNGIWTDITGSGGFYLPFSITVDVSGNVYVADTYNNKIKKLSNGIWTDITGLGGINEPYDIAVDVAGNVYITEMGMFAVKKKFNDAWIDITGYGVSNVPHYIDVDVSGNMYVTNMYNNKITRINAVPTEANASSNSITSSTANATVGDSITLTAVGDRQSAAGLVNGDERYAPAAWVSTESGKSGTFTLQSGSYTSTYTVSSPGNYTVTATFIKQTWNGNAWNNTAVTDTKTTSITVNAAPTTANVSSNSITSSTANATVGDSIILTAVGDRQSAAGLVNGDERYVPAAWESTESGKSGTFTLQGGSYTSTYTVASQGNYTVTATFVKQTWNGNAWNDTAVTDTKTTSITVNAAPTITTQPADQTITVGQPVSFSVVAAGTSPFSYQWRKNGTDISGATSATYTIANPQVSDSGIYTVVVTNALGSITSSAAVLYYPISSASDLSGMNSNPSFFYTLTQDIDLNTAPFNQGEGWSPIGTYSSGFEGTFDGKGHVIKNLYINRPDSNEQGLFGAIGNGGAIKNLRLENASVNGGGNTGILAGMINGSGTIVNCSTTGTVNGKGRVGGLVGSIENSGALVSRSLSTASVISVGNINYGDAGGLSGTLIFGAIYNCYATGSVSGSATGSFGGLVGYMGYGKITASYAAGNVSGATINGGFIGFRDMGLVTGCFYDSQTSPGHFAIGNSVDNGVSGKATSGMKQQVSFTGWDFSSIWSIQEGVTYPYLQWQVPTTANVSNNSITPSAANATAGDSITLTAVGDRQSAAGLMNGDERYIPSAWESTESGKSGTFTLQSGSYTSTYTVASPGNYTVTATFVKQTWNGTAWNNTAVTDTKTTSITVNAVQVMLNSIAITTPASKLVYTVGDSLDITGMVVTGTYSDNSTKTESITAANVTGFDSSAPAASQTLTVTVGGKTATYTVVIEAAPVTLQSIAITTPASKLVYTVGDSLDITGMVVTGTYSDNSTKTESITAANVTGFDSSAPAASQTLTVTVGGKTATYTISIVPPGVVSPNLQKAVTSITGDKIILTFEKAMEDPAGNQGAFTVNANSGVVNVASTALETDTKKIALTLASPVSAGSTVTLSYTPGSVRAADGGVLESFTNQTVINYVPVPVTTSTVVIVEPDKPNISITGSTTTSTVITVTVPENVENAGISIADLLNTSSGTVTSSPLPALNVSAAVNLNSGNTPINVQMSVTTGTVVSVPESANWDGTINMPTVQANNSITVTPSSGTSASVQSVIEVGYGDIPLTFSKAVRLLIPGQAGKKVGYTRNGVFTRITTVLSADDQDTADRMLPDGGDGYINVNSDLVIWTKHFTKFVTYTETPVNNGGPGDSGGSTGSSPVKPSISIPERIWGTDRYDTAVKIAEYYFPDGADTVILARGDISADALTAVPLSKHYNAPLLLTPQNKLPQGVLDRIKALKAKNVIIMGGEGAVSSEIANVLTALGIKVRRISGADRYDTAYKTAKELGTTGRAVIVNGNDDSYADALSTSSWAAYNKVPVLYGDGSDTLPEATLKAINELKVTDTILIGGYGVLPKSLESKLPRPVRYGGDNRFDTNAKVLGELQPQAVNVFAATGNDFADALAGAAVAGQSDAWVVLTGSKNNGGLTDSQAELLKSVKGRVQNYHVFGGRGAVSDDTLTVIKSLLGVK